MQSPLQAAESILALLEDRRREVNRLRYAADCLDDLVMRERPRAVLLLEPEEPAVKPNVEPVEARVPPVREEMVPVQVPSIPFDEQQTQAVDESLLPTLEDEILEPEPPAEPPIRRPVEEPEAEEPEIVAEEPEAEQPEAEQPEAEQPEAEQPEIDAKAREEARERAAAQIRMATLHAENAIQRATAQSQKADDEAYRKARNQGVAAIQLTAGGDARAVQDMVAIAEAEEEDLNAEAARSSGAEGGLKVDVLVPEVDIEADADLPELTDSAAPFSILTELKVKDDPVSGQIAHFLANARTAELKGDLQEAIVAYGDALDVNGSLEIAWLGRGRCRTEIGDFGAALSDLKRAQSLSPRSVSAVVEMGNLFYARKGYLEAIQYYGEALAIEPGSVLALGRRGLCHHYLGDQGQALRDLREAMQLDPSTPNLRGALEMVEQGLDEG